MPFRKQNIMKRTNSGTCKTVTIYTDEVTGIKSEKLEDCNKTLPDKEIFKISNQIKAGVPLKEINTKIITPTAQEINKAIENTPIKKAEVKNAEPTNE